MDYSKLNLDEVLYFCKSTRCRIDFDCLPFSSKIEFMAEILFYYGIDCFTAEDIKGLFEILKLQSSRTGKIISPPLKKIQDSIKGLSNVKPDKGDTFKILYSDTIYSDELKYGYEKKYIKG